jgi:Domain of unknown function in PX-proteins (DUF3818)
MAISDGITNIQKSIDMLISQRIQDFNLADRIKQYTASDDKIKEELKAEADAEQIDLLICIIRSEHFEPEPVPEQIETVWNAYIAWNNAVENVRCQEIPFWRTFANNHRLIKRCDRARNSLLISSNCLNYT